MLARGRQKFSCVSRSSSLSLRAAIDGFFASSSRCCRAVVRVVVVRVVVVRVVRVVVVRGEQSLGLSRGARRGLLCACRLTFVAVRAAKAEAEAEAEAVAVAGLHVMRRLFSLPSHLLRTRFALIGAGAVRLASTPLFIANS